MKETIELEIIKWGTDCKERCFVACEAYYITLSCSCCVDYYVAVLACRLKMRQFRFYDDYSSV